VVKKARYDEQVIYEILDQARLCHVAALVNGAAVALPTLHFREGRTVFLHGSPSNEVMKAVLREGEAFVTATLYEGLRLARSGFHSSIAFRSVVVVGAAHEVLDESEKLRVLNLFIDRVLPGRAREVRPLSDKEVRLTMVVAVAIDEASAKISSGPTDDDDEDMALSIWSGTVPARLVFESPIPDVDGAMSSGAVEVPTSVRRLLEQQ
jgi:nitroimidazol reductase NimA-like FMN-containing flavoprotein (pyridoxamine 5'-phosphate oxidase superfamily)